MKIKGFVKKIWAGVLWLVIWQAAAMLINKRLILVSPVEVVKRLFELLPDGAFWSSIFETGGRIILGYLLGLAVGAVLAVLAAKVGLLRDFFSPFMLTVKAVPVASFTILALFFLSSENLAILVTFLIALPIVYSNILTGIDSMDKRLVDMANLFRIAPHKKAVYIYFSQILPYFKTAASVSAGLSWKSGVAAELIVITTASIGEMLYQAKVELDSASLFAWTFVVILLSRLTELVFVKLIDGAWHTVEKL